jgi:dihydroflavonol-4-reductase
VRAFVTGGTGFVGSAVVRRLLLAGHEVRCLARPGSDRRNLSGLEVEVIEGDLRDPSSLRRGMDGCQAVFHVAADYRLWTPDPSEMYDVNVAGTRRVLQAAVEAEIERIVYTSSVATLGLRTDGGAADEETPSSLEDMIGHYKRSKFMAEEAVRELIASRGVPAVIVNPSTPVGPRDLKPTPTGRMILDAATGRMPAYVDTGLNIVHVDDVAAGHLLAYERGCIGERYILGGADMNLREILVVIAGLTGRQPPRLRLPHAAVLPIAHLSEWWARARASGEPRVTVDGVRMSRKLMYFSSKKAAAALGYRFRPARDALRDAVTWFLERSR